ncbi:glycoside hydrolase family 43 protein [Actinomyces urinae]|uniref:glycoside hydrolase family 43 protein n=1 Tax=Actinomyces urinae TaxID=1689268 RepID=UPI0009308B8D|nr:glycoside hydrolase family 43 protein [Actinomyces urinae]
MAKKQFTNPVRYVDGSQHTNPDPFVINFAGTYFCYSTGIDGVNLSVSKDLVTWEHKGFCYREEGRDSYWAPCVVYRNGVFYMYVSNRPAGEADPHFQRMRVATSQTPEGPFIFHSQMLDEFAIDADVVTGNDGVTVMFYASNELTSQCSELIGTSVVVDVMPTLFTLRGKPVPVIVPTIKEEMFEANRFGDGRDWYTIEGSTYFTDGEFAYQTYSGNAYENPDYFIGVTRAKVKPAIAQMEWTKQPSDDVYMPLIRQSDLIEGTGHNSIVRGPNLLDRWICYHGRDRKALRDFSVEQRQFYLDRIFIAGDEVLCCAPTSQAQDAPKMATMSGVGRPTENGKPLAESVRDFIAELYLKSDPGEAAGDCREVGFSLSTNDVWMRFAVRETEVECSTSDGRVENSSVPIEINLSVWQPFRILRSQGRVALLVGEVELLSMPDGVVGQPCELQVSEGATRLSYWRLTQLFEASRAQLESNGYLRPAESLQTGGRVHELSIPIEGEWQVELYFNGNAPDSIQCDGEELNTRVVNGRERGVITFAMNFSSPASSRIRADLSGIARCLATKIS